MLVMRLTPPELGTVRVEFILRQGQLSARLVAEDDGVRQSLERALPEIRAAVRAEHPTVEVVADRSDSRQNWSDGQGRHDRREPEAGGQGQGRQGDVPAFSLDGEAAPVTAAAMVQPIRQLGGRAGPSGVDALA
jgi:flagellar hook-length control protein FliK